MRLVGAHARAFGPLRDESLELSRRMTVIHGPNEAGKSTWHAAINAALCGRRRAARTKVEQEFAEQYQPWEADAWAVSAEVDLDDGRKLEVRQVLDDPAASRVVERETGRDVTSEFLSDGAPDLSRVLGLSRDTMPAISTVRQTEITRVQEDADALQAQLQTATSKAGADGTAETAITRIEKYKSEHVGLRRANSKRPLQTALNRRREAKRELEEAVWAHEDYLELVAKREEAEAKAKVAESRLGSAQHLLEVEELEKQRQRLRRARELQESVPAGEPPDIDDLARQEDRIRKVLTRYEERPEAPEPLDGPSAEDLARELADLPEALEGDTEIAEEVHRAHRAWRQALGELGSHDRYRPETPSEEAAAEVDTAELRRLADALEAPRPAPDENLSLELEAVHRKLGSGYGRLASIVGGVGLLAAAVVLLVQGLEPIWWASALGGGLLLLALGIRPSAARRELELRARSLEAEQAIAEREMWKYTEDLDRARRRLADLGLPTEGGALRRRAREREEIAASRERLDVWLEGRAALERVVAEGERELEELLRRKLDTRGEPGPGMDLESRGEAASPSGTGAREDRPLGLDARYELYETACRERRERASQAAKRPALEQSLKTRRRLEEASEEASTRRESAERALLELAGSLGVEVEDSRHAAEKLRARADELGKSLLAWREATGHLAKLEEILGGGDLAELEREVESLAAAVEAEPSDVERVDLGEEPGRALAELQREYEERRDELSNLRGRIADRETRLPSVAEAEETLSEAEEEVGQVERLERTLEVTLRFLDAARERVQRDLAPHLRRALEEDLSMVTGGRYAKARVDPATLEVTVQEAYGGSNGEWNGESSGEWSDGEWRPASLLSRGTTEQIYLLLRVALARHLSALGEPSPVFLDDPTVQCDRTRTRAILEVLKSLSEKHQIILFSQEEEVRQWAAQEDPEVVKLIELEAP